jgi:hypothetical protein
MPLLAEGFETRIVEPATALGLGLSVLQSEETKLIL